MPTIADGVSTCGVPSREAFASAARSAVSMLLTRIEPV